MARPRAILFGRMDIPAEIEDEFNAWYNEEHLAWRVERVPGFLAGRRFRAIEGTPKYATLYDLASVEALEDPAYRALSEQERHRPTPRYQRCHSRFEHFTRSVYEEITPSPLADYRPPAEARILLMAALVPKPEHEDECNAWYNTEHLPALAAVPGVLTARRFRLVEGGGPRYVAFYDVTSYDVFKSPAYLRNRESPWADRIRRNIVSRERCVYERIYVLP